MARPEHPKKQEGLTLLLTGKSPRVVAEALGVSEDTAKTWQRSLKKPGKLAQVARAVNPDDPDSLGRKLGQLLDEQIEALIAIQRQISGKHVIKYLDKQNISDISQFAFASTGNLVRLGEMRERVEDELEAERAEKVETAEFRELPG